MAGRKKGRIVLIVIVVAFIAFGIVFFDALGSNYPAGVQSDADEIRSATLGGGRHEVLTYEDEEYVLSPDAVEVYSIDEGSRDFISRDRSTLWLRDDTAENLGLDPDRLEPADQ